MSVTTFWTISLIIHGLLALALIGAISHQAFAVALPVRRAAGNFVQRYRAVPAAGYATAVCILYILTFLMGAWIYTKYRVYVRIPIEQYGFWKTTGAFELKEHVVAVGLALLPAYWWLWRGTKSDEYDTARKAVTVLLALIVWYAFLAGHIVNNVRGFGS
jgi:hypothetical protein